MEIITDENIMSDIQEYESRIQEAELELSKLPTAQLPYQQHKAREATRRELKSESEHVRRLLGYAAEALAE